VTKRILAIGVIFIGTSIAWMILGTTIFARTFDREGQLSGKVGSTWGTKQEQRPPNATLEWTERRESTTTENGRTTRKMVDEHFSRSLLLDASQLGVTFDLDYRQKGLLWYSTYKINFAGTYTFTNTAGHAGEVTFKFPFPAAQAVYDDLQFTIAGRPVSFASDENTAVVTAELAAGESARLGVAYRSQGLESWRYKFGDKVTQVRDFAMVMKTNFGAIDFPENTLSPTEKSPTGNGWELVWRYKNLLSGFEIGMTMPEKLQPGPLAGEISYFAPVSLLFFFFVMFIITTLRGIDLHPMNYFFLACAFFAFHLLLAYTVDHLSIHAAFVLASAVSVFLVVSYLRLAVGMRFAAVEAGISQFIYLVLFSYAFFFQGFTGLAVTIGAIVTLFVAMQMTGRIKWAEKFAAPRSVLPRVPPVPPIPPAMNPRPKESWLE
jgi:inner membrane protein involved in colicin E2 resistance